MNLLNILIVEDNKLDQKAITKVLDKHGGYQYTLAGTLKEAREKLRATLFDLVLVDANLPDGSTGELFSELTSKVPFVIVAGAGDEEYAIRAYKAGASDYLIKDVDRFYLKLIPSTLLKALKHKELEQLKESFIGTVSHELRTPLTIIGLGLENLQDGLAGPLNQKQADLVESNIRNAKRLGKLIDNLLDLSRLQSGRTNRQQKALNLNALIHEVLQSFQEEKKEESMIEEKFMTDLPEIEADPDSIAQVLTNLLSNAVRYAEKKIVITTKTSSGANGAPEFVETVVSNDGPGISPENLGKLFNSFVQLDRAQRMSSYKGTGLGLVICKEIIEQHHGKIGVESQWEKGVAFYFTLPIPTVVEG